MRIREVFRYTAIKKRELETIDGLPNFAYFTDYTDANLVQLESGINPIGKNGGDKITPAILISSSPHKMGSAETPGKTFLLLIEGILDTVETTRTRMLSQKKRKEIKHYLLSLSYIIVTPPTIA
jgi:hypothetical protein